MTTKSEIKLFISTEQNKAIEAITKKYEKIIYARKKEIIEERGYGDKARAVQEHINRVYNMVAELENNVNSDNILSLNTYRMLAKEMSNFIGTEGYINELINRTNYDRTNIPLIKNEQRELERETNTNYQNLRNAVSQMTTKNATEHLKKMDFDVSSIENKTTETALLALVDKTKLFYPRKTEEE